MDRENEEVDDNQTSDNTFWHKPNEISESEEQTSNFSEFVNLVDTSKKRLLSMLKRENNKNGVLPSTNDVCEQLLVLHEIELGNKPNILLTNETKVVFLLTYAQEEVKYEKVVLQTNFIASLNQYFEYLGNPQSDEFKSRLFKDDMNTFKMEIIKLANCSVHPEI